MLPFDKRPTRSEKRVNSELSKNTITRSKSLPFELPTATWSSFALLDDSSACVHDFVNVSPSIPPQQNGELIALLCHVAISRKNCQLQMHLPEPVCAYGPRNVPAKQFAIKTRLPVSSHGNCVAVCSATGQTFSFPCGHGTPIRQRRRKNPGGKDAV